MMLAHSSHVLELVLCQLGKGYAHSSEVLLQSSVGNPMSAVRPLKQVQVTSMLKLG